MKVITNELKDAALDWAMAKCEGKLPASYDDWRQTWPRYSTDPSHGHPIIERELIGTMPVSDAWWRAGDVDGANGFGPTMLIAAMRCYVASKLGDEVDVPEELL